MQRIRNILHPTDGSPAAEAALACAMHLARHHGADLHVLRVDPALPMLPGVVPDPKSTYGRFLERDEEVGGAAQAPGVKVHHLKAYGLLPAPVILDYARSQEIDLVVQGVRGARRGEAERMEDVVLELVRRPSCPVLTVPEGETRRPTFEHIQRVLVTLDLTQPVRPLLAFARTFAAFYGAELAVLHVSGSATYVSASHPGVPQADSYQRAVHIRHQLEQLYEAAGGPDVPVTFHAQFGYAPYKLTEFAAANAVDCILTASHGLTGSGYCPVMGALEHLICNAPCPVLTLKPPQHSPRPRRAGELTAQPPASSATASSIIAGAPVLGKEAGRAPVGRSVQRTVPLAMDPRVLNLRDELMRVEQYLHDLRGHCRKLGQEAPRDRNAQRDLAHLQAHLDGLSRFLEQTQEVMNRLVADVREPV